MTESGFVRCKPGPGPSCPRNSLDLPHCAVRPFNHRNSADPAEGVPDEDASRGLLLPIYLQVEVEPLGTKTGPVIVQPSFSRTEGRCNTQAYLDKNSRSSCRKEARQ